MLIAASKKQTPFSVWYENRYASLFAILVGLKEADAFQRLVFHAGVHGFVRGCVASKKQTPFSVWYAWQRVRLLLFLGVASKKQTPFSVWYLSVGICGFSP